MDHKFVDSQLDHFLSSVFRYFKKNGITTMKKIIC